MAIQDTDLFLINRAGASYKVAASDLVSKVQAGDLALVNRSGSSYKLTGDKLTAGTFNDTDLFIINRAGASYKVAGSEIKTLLIPPVPRINDARWSFAGLQPDGSYFKLDVTFASGAVLDFTQPTDVELGLVSRRSTALAALRAPVPFISASDYRAENWANTTTSEIQTLSSNFTPLNGGNILQFRLFVPNTVKVGGINTPAKDSGINQAIWGGTIGVFQNGGGNTITFREFATDDGFFN